MATFTTTSTATMTMTRPTAPQANTAPENRLGFGRRRGPAARAGACSRRHCRLRPLGRAPVALPDFPVGDLPDTGRLWARLRSLALWFVVPPERAAGFGLFPPVTGFFFWSSCHRAQFPDSCACRSERNWSSSAYGLGPTSEARAGRAVRERRYQATGRPSRLH